MEIPQGNTWKIAENRALKWGSSPPPPKPQTYLADAVPTDLMTKYLPKINERDPEPWFCWSTL
jgi:hypothetical protein